MMCYVTVAIRLCRLCRHSPLCAETHSRPGRVLSPVSKTFKNTAKGQYIYFFFASSFLVPCRFYTFSCMTCNMLHLL